MEQKVKELRVSIDGLAQLTKGLEKPIKVAFEEILSGNTGRIQVINYRHSKEVDKTVDSLFLAKAWLGKVLGALGTESPYPKDGSRKTVEDIEPTADRCDLIKADWDKKNHIEKVDWLRQEIQKVVKEVDSIPRTLQMMSDELNVSAHQSKIHLSEARFWLGFELEKIRENEK